MANAHSTAVGNKILVLKGEEGEGKRNLMKACACEYGVYFKELVCNKNISSQYIMRFVQGAISAGAWLSFYEFEHLDDGVLIRLFRELKSLITSIQTAIPPTLLDLRIKKMPEALAEGEEPVVGYPKTTIKTTNRVLFSFITHSMNP